METAPYLTDAAGRRFPLTEAVTRLGRSPDARVFVPDRRASRQHAEIRYDGHACTLCHVSQTNDTLLNGRSLTTPQILHEGDEITIASAVFTFHDPESTVRMSEFPLLVVDEGSGEIWVNRRPVSLSPKEQALFTLLHLQRGLVCGKQMIAEAVWPEYRAEVYDYQIESLIKRLRRKLEPDPRHPVLVLTVGHLGYRLVPRRESHTP